MKINLIMHKKNWPVTGDFETSLSIITLSWPAVAAKMRGVNPFLSLHGEKIDQSNNNITNFFSLNLLFSILSFKLSES
jgi:hypothetical protein